MNKDPRLDALLRAVFDDFQDEPCETLDSKEYEQRRLDFVFHMTDWMDDIDGILNLFSNPDQKDVDSATTFLVGFLYHVVPHLNAAAKLLLGEVGDPFSSKESPQHPP
ncbi:MAG: hypothetical protein ACKV0T_07755 [Planctomycetales bacterium]